MVMVNPKYDAYQALKLWAQRNNINIEECRVVDESAGSIRVPERRVMKIIKGDRTLKEETYNSVI